MIETVFHAKLAAKQPFVARLLSSAVNKNRLAHAYLFVGRAEEDKLQIALDLACFLNCANVASGQPEQACCLKRAEGSGGAAASDTNLDPKVFCQNCRWILEQKHPQAWILLSSDETKSGKIPVEKARKLCDELAKESQYVRVVVIDDASQESFHRPAANALLRTIEDPKVNCLFVLFSTSVDDVLPTVVSRCQVLPFHITDSTGLSIRGNNLSGFAPEIVVMAKEAIEKYMRRHDAKSLFQVLQFNRELVDVIGNDFSPHEAIDLLVAIELQRIAAKALTNAAWSGYAKSLIGLSESTKEQLDHSVSLKAAMESFTLSWWRLAIPETSVAN